MPGHYSIKKEGDPKVNGSLSFRFIYTELSILAVPVRLCIYKKIAILLINKRIAIVCFEKFCYI